MRPIEELTDREIDALVLAKVMGFRFWKEKRGTYDGIDSYTTDISAAWEVVEKMRADGWWWSSYGNALTNTVKDVCVTFQKYEDTDAQTKFKVYAPTMPRAICLAALRAKGITHA